MSQTTDASKNVPQNLPPTFSPRKNKSKKRKKIIKHIIGWTITAAIIAVIVYFVRVVLYAPEPVYYQTGLVSRLPYLSSTVEGYGYAKPVESVTVNAVVGGTILQSYIYEGAILNEGDPICTISGLEIDKAIESLNKELETLRENITKLEGQKSKVYEDIAKVNKEQNEQAEAATLKTPFTGKLLNVERKTVGDYITRGDRIATLVVDHTMLLRQYFSYGYINDITVGQPAKVSIPATMSVVDGAVKSIEQVKSVQPDGTVTFEVTISIPNPGALTKDMIATATLSKDDETILPTVDGILEYEREQIIYSGASGNITSYNLRNFHEYQAGQILMTVDFVPDNSAIEGYLTAIKSYDEQIEAINIQIEEKLAAITEQEELYPLLDVTAPRGGTVVFASAMPEQKVETGFTLCNIADMREMIVEAQIEQQHVSKFSVGMPVNLRYWGGDGQVSIMGYVKSISLEGKNEYGYTYFPCLISVDNSDNLLRSDFGLNYEAVLSESYDPLVVPINAVKPTDNGVCVFVKMDERPENAIDIPGDIVPPGFFAIEVECGISNREYIEIISGIEEGWEVYTQKTFTKPSPSPEDAGDDSSGSISVIAKG